MRLLVAIAALTGLTLGEPPRAAGPDYVAVLVARSFLQALSERDVKQASDLCAATVNFDGQELSGARRDRERIAKLVQDFPAGYRFRTVVFMRYRDAVDRFGPPPKRLRLGELKRSVVAFGRLPHKGLVVFVKKSQGRWRIVALSD